MRAPRGKGSTGSTRGGPADRPPRTTDPEGDKMAKKMGGKGKPGFSPKGDLHGKDSKKKHGGKGRI